MMNRLTITAILISFFFQQVSLVWEDDHHASEIHHENILVERFAYLADEAKSLNDHTDSDEHEMHSQEADQADCDHCHHCYQICNHTLLSDISLDFQLPTEQLTISFVLPSLKSPKEELLRPPIS